MMLVTGPTFDGFERTSLYICAPRGHYSDVWIEPHTCLMGAWRSRCNDTCTAMEACQRGQA